MYLRWIQCLAVRQNYHGKKYKGNCHNQYLSLESANIHRGKFMKLLSSVVLLALFSNLYINNALADSSSVSASTSAWNGANDPAIMSTNFEVILSKLPTKGNLFEDAKAWPGYYWANNKGGIAQRWNAPNPEHFKYESPTRSEITFLSSTDINRLSPAEKFDLFLGRYDYPLVKKVWGQTSRFASEWHGICHGVAPASLNHSEPKTVTVTNPDGIEVTFYAADLKALLAYYYAKVSDRPIKQVGKRCFINSWVPFIGKYPGCKDVNAGAFHIIMANKLGLEKTGFIADMDRFKEVWNHAALEFSSVIGRALAPSRKSAPGTVRRVFVRTTVKYSASIDPQQSSVIGTPLAEYDERNYTYWLDLDYKGEIIGGEWSSKDRPDFLWIKEKEDFKGEFSALYQLLQ
jgi:hypothetical protein